MAKDIVSLDKVLDFLDTKGGVGDPNQTATLPKFYRIGVPVIDAAIGGGQILAGIPMGQMSEVYGPNACGKTTLLYAAIAQAQKDHPDKVHLWLDVEGTSDPRYMKACGVDFDATVEVGTRKVNTLQLFRTPRVKTLEQAIELFLLFHKTGRLGICVVDSLAAANPEKELDRIKGDLSGNAGVSAKAKRMADISRLLISELGGTDSAITWINHEIANIKANPYEQGPSKTTPGGDAVKYYSALRLQLIPKGNLVEEQETVDKKKLRMAVGKNIQLYVEKNKLGVYGQRVNYVIRPGEGIDAVTPLIALAIEAGVIQKRGGTHKVKLPDFDALSAPSAEKFRLLVKSNPELQGALMDATRAYVPKDFSEIDAILGTGTLPNSDELEIENA